MELTDVLLFIHIVAAMVWLGGGFLVTIFGSRMKAADPQHALGFARSMRKISMGVFMPASLVVLAMGIWMVADSEVFEFSQAWVVIGLVVIGITAVMGPTFFKPNIAKGVAAMEGGGGPQVGAIMSRISIGSKLALLLEFVAVWAMVVKPGL